MDLGILANPTLEDKDSRGKELARGWLDQRLEMPPLAEKSPLESCEDPLKEQKSFTHPPRMKLKKTRN